jgi:hypothetical protein
MNNGFTILNDGSCAADGFGIPSWYQLNSKVQRRTTNGPAAAARPVHLVQHRRHAGGSVDRRAAEVCPLLSYVKRTAEMVMLVEAPNPNWHDGSESKKYPGNFLVDLAGRHGRKNARGDNAWTNMAFFRRSRDAVPDRPIRSEGRYGNFKQGTIFFLGKQR